jgi:hypothetical protein
VTAPAYTVDPDDDEVLDARAELGYGSPRQDEPADLDVREEAPPAPATARTGPTPLPAHPNLAGARGDCKFCPAKDVLHQTPSNIHRTACAACVGAMFRDNAEYTRTTIRRLKAAAATGDAHAERVAIAQLRGMVGAAQAEQTVQAIRTMLEAQASGGRR